MSELSVLVLAALLAALVVVTGLWLVWTANRLDKLHLRCAVAVATLEQQALRRCLAAQELAVSGSLTDPASALLLNDAAAATRDLSGDERWSAESDLTAVLRLVEPVGAAGPFSEELSDAARRLEIGRRVHNDVVASTLALRSRRRVRWFHLAGHAVAPSLVAFDDRAT